MQVIHRTTAYLLLALSLFYIYRLYKSDLWKDLRSYALPYIVCLGFQFTLGILTIINSIGRVPTSYGALHQAVAFLMLLLVIRLRYFQKNRL